MIKVFCDKCGEEIDTYEAYTVTVESPLVVSWKDQYPYNRKEYHMCRDCMNEVADFIMANND